MEILIAGGAGFIGSHLAERIRGEIFDLRTGQDGRDFGQVREFVKGKELVYHLANIPAHRMSISSPHDIVWNNYITTLNLAEACRILDCRMVFASSFGVYGSQRLPFREDSELNPGTPYGLAKKSCEELLKMYNQLYGMDITIVRPSNVWGERDHLHQPLQVLPLWIGRVKEGKEITVYGEDTTRDFTHIEDFISGIVSASKIRGFDIFNISSGKDIRLLDIAKSLTEKVVVKPLPGHEVEKWRGDISKAEQTLGWRPKRDFWEEFAKYKERLLGQKV